MTSENQEEWIEKAQTLSKNKLEREVAAANPSAPQPERARPTGPDRIRIEFDVTYDEDADLKRGVELLSQMKNKNAKMGETVVIAIREWLERHDPVRKAERVQARKAKRAQEKAQRAEKKSDQSQDRSEKATSHRSRDRSAIPAEVRHQVYLRDRGACRKRMPDGSTCGCRKWTDIHHIIHVAYGGTNTLENLITLCRSHHRQLHENSA